MLVGNFVDGDSRVQKEGRRLRMAVSDVEAVGDLTRRLGNGEVFEVDDAEGFARAVQAVAADRERYAAVYTDEFGQALALLVLYERVSELRPVPPGRVPAARSGQPAPPTPPNQLASLPILPRAADTGPAGCRSSRVTARRWPGLAIQG